MELESAESMTPIAIPHNHFTDGCDNRAIIIYENQKSRFSTKIDIFRKSTELD